jgi:hypothetical protein
LEHPELYNVIELGGVKSPGIVTLSGHDRNEKWDVKGADGVGGASTTYKGEEIAQFQASFYLVYDPVLALNEFAAWESFAALIRSSLPPSGKPKALAIYHPDLAANDIKSVCKASIGGMSHDGKGGATVVVKLLEFRPPKKKKSSGSPVPAKTAPTKPDPNADLKAEIDALLKQAQAP